MAEGLTQLQGLPLGAQIRVQRLTATWDLTTSGLLEPWLDMGEVGTRLSGLTKLDISVAEWWKPGQGSGTETRPQEMEEGLEEGKRQRWRAFRDAGEHRGFP